MYFSIRRVFEIFFSFILLVALSPLFFLIGFAIKIDSKGPVFFTQGRLGKNGEIFTIFKFRTMIENAESKGTGLYNYEDDFRVTRVGKFLRVASLDEFPQLFNILLGNMSFVGPRPPVSYELGRFEDLNEEYKKRFTVLPGVTGLAQVSGRNELSWDEKVKFDNKYIEEVRKWKILADAKIIFLTIIKVLNMEGSFEIKEDSKRDTDS
jgi:lipopolysaccharide/colanic/teichoic acid biosynthesis glycosyltransferase